MSGKFASIGHAVQAGFTGTESKLKVIAEKLEEIVGQADDDRIRRIDRLRAQREKIDSEIQTLLLGGKVETLTSLEIRERYQLVIGIAQNLRRDFTTIRDRFKELAIRIVEMHANSGFKRGHVLRNAIDDEMVLRDSDEGRSFSAFQQFLLHPESQERFFALIEEVENLPAIATAQRGNRVLHNLPAVLLAEARGVVETNQRLSVILRRLLDSVSIRSRRETADLLTDIKTAAYALKDDPPEGVIHEVNGDINLELSETMVRVLWQASEEVQMPENLVLSGDGDKVAALAALGAVEHVDFQRLNTQIDDTFARIGRVFHLADILELHPPAPSRIILDLLGYFTLARRNSEHWSIRTEKDVAVVVPVCGATRALRVPEITFYRPPSNSS